MQGRTTSISSQSQNQKNNNTNNQSNGTNGKNNNNKTPIAQRNSTSQTRPSTAREVPQCPSVRSSLKQQNNTQNYVNGSNLDKYQQRSYDGSNSYRSQARVNPPYPPKPQGYPDPDFNQSRGMPRQRYSINTQDDPSLYDNDVNGYDNPQKCVPGRSYSMSQNSPRQMSFSSQRGQNGPSRARYQPEQQKPPDIRDEYIEICTDPESSYGGPQNQANNYDSTQYYGVPTSQNTRSSNVSYRNRGSVASQQLSQRGQTPQVRYVTDGQRIYCVRPNMDNDGNENQSRRPSSYSPPNSNLNVYCEQFNRRLNSMNAQTPRRTSVAQESVAENGLQSDDCNENQQQSIIQYSNGSRSQYSGSKSPQYDQNPASYSISDPKGNSLSQCPDCKEPQYPGADAPQYPGSGGSQLPRSVSIQYSRNVSTEYPGNDGSQFPRSVNSQYRGSIASSPYARCSAPQYRGSVVNSSYPRSNSSQYPGSVVNSSYPRSNSSQYPGSVVGSPYPRSSGSQYRGSVVGSPCPRSGSTQYPGSVAGSPYPRSSGSQYPEIGGSQYPGDYSESQYPESDGLEYPEDEMSQYPNTSMPPCPSNSSPSSRDRPRDRCIVPCDIIDRMLTNYDINGDDEMGYEPDIDPDILEDLESLDEGYSAKSKCCPCPNRNAPVQENDKPRQSTSQNDKINGLRQSGSQNDEYNGARKSVSQNGEYNNGARKSVSQNGEYNNDARKSASQNGEYNNGARKSVSQNGEYNNDARKSASQNGESNNGARKSLSQNNEIDKPENNLSRNNSLLQSDQNESSPPKTRKKSKISIKETPLTTTSLEPAPEMNEDMLIRQYAANQIDYMKLVENENELESPDTTESKVTAPLNEIKGNKGTTLVISNSATEDGGAEKSVSQNDGVGTQTQNSVQDDSKTVQYLIGTEYNQNDVLSSIGRLQEHLRKNDVSSTAKNNRVTEQRNFNQAEYRNTGMGGSNDEYYIENDDGILLERSQQVNYRPASLPFVELSYGQDFSFIPPRTNLFLDRGRVRLPSQNSRSTNSPYSSYLESVRRNYYTDFGENNMPSRYDYYINLLQQRDSKNNLNKKSATKSSSITDLTEKYYHEALGLLYKAINKVNRFTFEALNQPHIDKSTRKFPSVFSLYPPSDSQGSSPNNMINNTSNQNEILKVSQSNLFENYSAVLAQEKLKCRLQNVLNQLVKISNNIEQIKSKKNNLKIRENYTQYKELKDTLNNNVQNHKNQCKASTFKYKKVTSAKKCLHRIMDCNECINTQISPTDNNISKQKLSK